MKDLYQPENDSEADVLKKVLEQHGIAVRVVSFHDTAYDGLFQSQRGWGVIRVAEEDFDRALEIIGDWKASAPSHLPWDKDEDEKM